MKYYSDYIEIIEGKFFEYKHFSYLSGDQFEVLKRGIDKLTVDLQLMDPTQKKILIEGLQKMSELGCYKAALSATINTAIVSDAKEPENQYVHARGSVLFGKKRRVWVSHYVGEARKYINSKGIVDTRIKYDNRFNVVIRLFERLKSLALGPNFED